MDVESFLSSKVAVSALRVLLQMDMPLPVSRIAKETGSNYLTTQKHMKLLEEAGLVTNFVYGKRTLYRANLVNGQVLTFKTFIEAWEGTK